MGLVSWIHGDLYHLAKLGGRYDTGSEVPDGRYDTSTEVLDVGQRPLSLEDQSS